MVIRFQQSVLFFMYILYFLPNPTRYARPLKKGTSEKPETFYISQYKKV